MIASTTGRCIARAIGTVCLAIALDGCSHWRRSSENAYAYDREMRILAAIRRVTSSNPLYYYIGTGEISVPATFLKSGFVRNKLLKLSSDKMVYFGKSQWLSGILHLTPLGRALMRRDRWKLFVVFPSQAKIYSTAIGYLHPISIAQIAAFSSLPGARRTCYGVSFYARLVLTRAGQDLRAYANRYDMPITGNAGRAFMVVPVTRQDVEAEPRVTQGGSIVVTDRIICQNKKTKKWYHPRMYFVGGGL